MARDKYHYLVKNALINEGWTITDDPLYVPFQPKDLEIDLGAERLIAAERGKEKIAVEIKSFLGFSPLHDFYKALGQFNFYFLALRRNEPERKLFLAVPSAVYDTFFQDPIAQEAIEVYQLKLVVYSIENENIVTWKK